MPSLLLGQNPGVHPTGIIAQPVHPRAAHPDETQQIGERHEGPFFYLLTPVADNRVPEVALLRDR